MSEPSESKPYEIFTRARKASIVETSSPATMVANVASSMANIADVLAELKSLRSDFGSKLDNIDNHVLDVANSIGAIESKLADVEQDTCRRGRNMYSNNRGQAAAHSRGTSLSH